MLQVGGNIHLCVPAPILSVSNLLLQLVWELHVRKSRCLLKEVVMQHAPMFPQASWFSHMQLPTLSATPYSTTGTYNKGLPPNGPNSTIAATSAIVDTSAAKTGTLVGKAHRAVHT